MDLISIFETLLASDGAADDWRQQLNSQGHAVFGFGNGVSVYRQTSSCQQSYSAISLTTDIFLYEVQFRESLLQIGITLLLMLP